MLSMFSTSFSKKRSSASLVSMTMVSQSGVGLVSLSMNSDTWFFHCYLCWSPSAERRRRAGSSHAGFPRQHRSSCHSGEETITQYPRVPLFKGCN